MFQKARSMLFAHLMGSAFIALTVLSCSMQADLVEFVEEGLSIVRITEFSYSQGTSVNIPVVNGSPVTVNLTIMNPRDLSLEYAISCDPTYMQGNAIPTIAPTGPGQNSVSFTFIPSNSAIDQTIVFTLSTRSPELNKTFKSGTVSIRCVSASNTDIRVQEILGSDSITYDFSSNGLTSALMGLTPGSTLTFLLTAGASGQTFSTSMNYDPSFGIYSGIQTSQTLDMDRTNTLIITVTAQDGTTTATYSLVVPPQGGFTLIPGGDYTVDQFKTAITDIRHIKLGGDINLTGPAATDTLLNPSFFGSTFVFDGAGHKISNLTITTDGGASFIMSNSGIIENLTLENVAITSSSTASASLAALVGVNWGWIYRCSVSGTIAAPNLSTNNGNAIGGLVGNTNVNTSNIYECYSTATVTGVNNVGGLVGYSTAGTIKNCYARGPVTGTSAVGGLVGTNTSPSIILNSYATNASSGSLIGLNSGTVTDCPYGPSPLTVNWNITNTVNPAYVWGIGSAINNGYPYLQYFGAQTMLP